jgi:hypothetical protein
MEEWFHKNNPKQKVNAANALVTETLELIQKVFPQWDKDGNKEGRGWAVSKFHGISKFVLYMNLFGSANNFHGGIGECNHKTFMKDTGFNTQKRIKMFTLQVAQRYYKGMTFCIAKKFLDARMQNDNNLDELSHQGNTSQQKYTVAGNYKITLFGLEDIGIFMDSSVSTNNLTPPLTFICELSMFSATKFNLCGIKRVTCYTSCKMYLENRYVTFSSTCNFGDDGYWYDWCLIEGVNNNEVRKHILGKFLVISR